MGHGPGRNETGQRVIWSCTRNVVTCIRLQQNHVTLKRMHLSSIPLQTAPTPWPKLRGSVEPWNLAHPSTGRTPSQVANVRVGVVQAVITGCEIRPAGVVAFAITFKECMAPSTPAKFAATLQSRHLAHKLPRLGNCP